MTCPPLPRPTLPRLRRVAALGLACILGVSALSAHMLNMTRVAVDIDRGEADIRIDVDLTQIMGGPSAYGALIGASAAEIEQRMPLLAQQVLHEVDLGFAPSPPEMILLSWTLPDTPPEKIGDIAVAAMTTFVFKARLAADTDKLRITTAPLTKVEFPLAYTLRIPATNTTLTRWVELPGMSGRELKIPDLARARPADPNTGIATATASSETPPAETDENLTPFEASAGRWVGTVVQFLKLGFLHIVPRGLDHILFVLGLFFLGAGWKALAKQTTAFTIAHTTTLGLSAYGIFSLPAQIVEPLIALSIAYIAVENIWRPRINAGRLAVVFLFGLLHGLGFASSLREVPMPRDQFFTALLSFNFGVDFGQLFVLGLAFLCVGWFREKTWYRQAIAIPACSFIAAIGLYWTINRAFF